MANRDILSEEILAEMVGLGGMAGGPMPEEGPPMDDLGGDDLGIDDEDMGLEGDDDMGLEDGLDEEMVEVDKATLQDLMQQVADGTMSVEDAMDQCCGMGDEGLDMGDELDMGDDMGGEADMGGLDMGGGEAPMPPMEDIKRIASMLTDDPDLFNE